MWFRIARKKIILADNDELLLRANTILSQLTNINDSVSGEELERRENRLAALREEIEQIWLSRDYRGYDPRIYETLRKISDLRRNIADELDIRQGRIPWYPDDPDNLLQHILNDPPEEQGPISLSIMLSYARKIPRDDPRKKEIFRLLTEKGCQMLGIDLSGLTGPGHWELLGKESDFDGMYDFNGEPLTHLSVGKHVELQDEDGGGITITFKINKINGISIYSEVGESDNTSDPEFIRQLRDFQINEITKFLNDVLTKFPEDWNKTIHISGHEEGDVRSILSGNSESKIRLFRMMSSQEYEKWLSGEVIPPGKYFATRREDAVGRDFADDEPGEVFSFTGTRSAFSGGFDSVVTSAVPLRLEGRKLIPLEESSIGNIDDILQHFTVEYPHDD